MTRATLVIEFGRCGFRIARRDLRLGCLRVWASRRPLLDCVVDRRVVVVQQTQPRDGRGRFVRSHNA